MIFFLASFKFKGYLKLMSAIKQLKVLETQYAKNIYDNLIYMAAEKIPKTVNLSVDEI